MLLQSLLKIVTGRAVGLRMTPPLSPPHWTPTVARMIALAVSDLWFWDFRGHKHEMVLENWALTSLGTRLPAWTQLLFHLHLRYGPSLWAWHFWFYRQWGFGGYRWEQVSLCSLITTVHLSPNPSHLAHRWRYSTNWNWSSSGFLCLFYPQDLPTSQVLFLQRRARAQCYWIG